MPYVGDSAFLLVCYDTIAPVTRAWPLDGCPERPRMYMVAVTRAISYITPLCTPMRKHRRVLPDSYFTLAALVTLCDDFLLEG